MTHPGMRANESAESMIEEMMVNLALCVRKVFSVHFLVQLFSWERLSENGVAAKSVNV